jgi:hypothetical protein
MPKGGKRSGAKRGKKRKRKSEKLVWKLGGRVAVRVLRGRSPEAVLRAAWDRYLSEGEETPGVHLIGSWRNPNNKNPKHSNWKTSDDEGQSLEGFFGTIAQRVGATSAEDVNFHAASARQTKATDALFAKRSEAAKRGAETKRKKMLKRATAKAEAAAAKRKAAKAKGKKR